MELNSRLALTKQWYEEVLSLVSLDDLNSEAYPTDESRLVLKGLVFKLVRELGILDRHYGIRNSAHLIPNQNVADKERPLPTPSSHSQICRDAVLHQIPMTAFTYKRPFAEPKGCIGERQQPATTSHSSSLAYTVTNDTYRPSFGRSNRP